jgi:hypothetical protein
MFKKEDSTKLIPIENIDVNINLRTVILDIPMNRVFMIRIIKKICQVRFLNEYNLYPFFKVEGYTVNYNDIRVEMLC